MTACTKSKAPGTSSVTKIIPPAILKAMVDKANATTSEDITFSLTLDAIASLNIDLPEVGGKIQGLRITDFGTDNPKKDGNRVLRRRWYKLRADITGSYVLPAIELKYQTPEGKTETLKTSEIFIEIKAPAIADEKGPNSDKGKEKKDIRDIKNLEPIESPRLAWILDWCRADHCSYRGGSLDLYQKKIEKHSRTCTPAARNCA